MAVQPAFVFSLSHSGSTLLDLTLGSHPDVIGLGEVYNFARKWLPRVLDGQPHVCSCGRDATQCAFWAPVVERLARLPRPSIEDTYEAVAARAGQLDPGTVVVDSSKKREALAMLASATGVDVPVVLLVRDVRGWIASRRDSPELRESSRFTSVVREHGARGLPRVFARQPIILARAWKDAHVDALRRLDSHRGPKFLVSYEELCLRPATALPALLAWLGLPETSAEIGPARSNSHVIAGNTIRRDESRRREIHYDVRWLGRREWVVPYRVLPGLRSLNEDLVWSRLWGVPASAGSDWPSLHDASS